MTEGNRDLCWQQTNGEFIFNRSAFVSDYYQLARRENRQFNPWHCRLSPLLNPGMAL